MNQWLESNPGKTERDWLIEVRCTTNTQREALKELLECCDACGIKYEICHEVDLDKEYVNLISSEPELQDILELKTMNTFDNFNGYCAVVFEDNGIEYNPYHVFDLYLPHIGWYINIGSEIEDATTERWTQQTATTHFEGNGLEDIPKARIFMNGFNEKLNVQYSTPKSNKFRNEVDGCKYYFLPWNKDVETDAKKSDLKDYKLLPGSVRMFWATLFKDNFNEMKYFRQELYLKNHADFKERRAWMLHSLVTEFQKGLGPNKTISTTQINKLLETVDNELSILYPEFGEIHY